MGDIRGNDEETGRESCRVKWDKDEWTRSGKVLVSEAWENEKRQGGTRKGTNEDEELRYVGKNTAR